MDGTQPLAVHDVLQPTYEAPAAPADMASQAKHCSRAALHNSSHLAQGAAGGEHFSDGILIAGAERKCGAICRGGGVDTGWFSDLSVPEESCIPPRWHGPGMQEEAESCSSANFVMDPQACFSLSVWVNTDLFGQLPFTCWFWWERMWAGCFWIERWDTAPRAQPPPQTCWSVRHGLGQV